MGARVSESSGVPCLSMAVEDCHSVRQQGTSGPSNYMGYKQSEQCWLCGHYVRAGRGLCCSCHVLWGRLFTVQGLLPKRELTSCHLLAKL